MKYQKIKLSIDSKIDGTVSVNGHEDIFNFLVAAEKSGDFIKGQEVVVSELEKVFEHNKKVLNAVTGINFELMYELMVGKCKELTVEEFGKYAADIYKSWDANYHGANGERPAEFYVFEDYFEGASVGTSWQMNIFDIMSGFIELNPDYLFLKSVNSFKCTPRGLVKFVAHASSLGIGYHSRTLLNKQDIEVKRIFHESNLHLFIDDIAIHETNDRLCVKTTATYKDSYELTFHVKLDKTEELKKDSEYLRLVEDINKVTDGDLTRYTLDCSEDFELEFLLKKLHFHLVIDHKHYVTIIDKLKINNTALDTLQTPGDNDCRQRRNQTKAL